MSVAPVAIVTGGAQGLGAAICVELLKQGYKVCIADIQQYKGKYFTHQQEEEFGAQNVIFSACDVTKEADYISTFDLTLKTFDRVDVLINNAGIILEQDPETLFSVNLLGPMIGCQTAIKYMGKSHGGKGGMVINMASILGFVPFSAAPAYVASKHGLIGLTRSFGLPYHLEKDGIIFAALCPSFTDTDLLKSISTNSLVPGLDYSNHKDIMSPEYMAQ
ncbi:15-hydroxyprostaglandin dehydrogenase, partial [Caerostris extrusa]